MEWFDVDPRPGDEQARFFEADAWNLCGRTEMDLQQGGFIIDWNPEVAFFAASSAPMEGPVQDVLRTSNLIPVFSKRLREALDANAINGIQYLPVSVFDSRRNSVGQYYGKGVSPVAKGSVPHVLKY